MVQTLITALREERAEVERLRKWCSAAANDYGKMAELFDKAGFPKSVQECIDTSEFLRDAAEGRADGTIYDDELSKSRAEVSRLQERVRVLEADVERRRLGKKVEDWPDWMQKASKIEGTPVLRHEIAALQQKENTDHE